MQKVIGIGEYAILDNVEGTMKTFALSSCIALTVYHRMKKVLGMVHIALPSSHINNNALSPGHYADKAVSLLIDRICTKYGCGRNELEINLFGGAGSIYKGDVFNIGRRNTDAVKTELISYGIRFNADETGGMVSRTVEMDVSTGKARVQYHPIRI